jgi:hypothetical protein
VMSKKLLVKFGDKVLCVLVLGWVIFQAIGAIAAWQGGSDIQVEIHRDLEVAKKASPVPVIEPLVLEYVKRYERSIEWSFSFDQSSPSVHYRRDQVDVNVLQEKYDEKWVSHDHNLHDIESGGKACVFPGCTFTEKPPEIYLGLSEDLKVEEATVMTVKISWSGVIDLQDADPKYCVVQKAVKGKDGVLSLWADVLDEDGVVLRVYGRSEGEEDTQASEGQAAIPAGFQLPGMASPVVTKDVDAEVVAAGPKTFSYLDFNLDPSTEYMYRVKSIGLSLRDGKVIEGLNWTKPVAAMTERDQGLRFTRYIPGLRDEDGQLKKRKDGSVVSMDKVYVKVSKLFNPPWSPMRYFISYEHRNIIPGESSSWAVGKMERRYSVPTETEEPVYIDAKKENFLFPTEGKDLASIKLEMESSTTKWRKYQVQMDFSTEWLAKDVVEEVEEEVVVTTRYNAMGKEETVEEPIKKYRYFLLIESKDTKAEVRLELERDDLETRILRY